MEFYSEKNIKSLKLTELMVFAKKFMYINPGTNEETWSTEEIYYAALYETLNSKYQIRASEIICGIFPPLKLLFKSTLRNYIKVMNHRQKLLHDSVTSLSS
jgi:hypothetical protein